MSSRSERKRQAILEAAVIEFSENGYQAANMDAISARADVSKRTLYNHFASKEGLFEQITAQLWMERIELRYSPEQPLSEQLNAFAEAKVTLMLDPEHIALSRCVMAAYMQQPEMAQQAMHRLANSEGALELWLNAASKDGRIKACDAKLAANQFYSLLKTEAFWPQVLAHLPAPSQERLDTLVEQSVAMFLQFYALEDSN